MSASLSLTPGQIASRGEIDIALQDADGNPANAAEVSFAIYFVDPGPPEVEVLQGAARRSPANPSMGEYYAPLMVPTGAVSGTYRVRWTIRQFVNSPEQQVVQEFRVVTPGTIVASSMSDARRDLVRELRVLLRDNNPDRNYRFRPPEHESKVGQYNRVFGYVWEDDELVTYLERSLDWFNMMPPMTRELNDVDKLVYDPRAKGWRTAIQWGAISHAAYALMANWVADEFDYSIGGVSLTLEKSSKYQSMYDAANQKVTESGEHKQQTVKYIRGLQQPKYGMGVRSAFGPYVGRGVLSPRSFM